MRERIKTEYGLDVTFEAPPYQTARWLVSDDPAILKAFIDKSMSRDVGYAQEKNPKIRFLTTKERL